MSKKIRSLIIIGVVVCALLIGAVAISATTTTDPPTPVGSLYKGHAEALSNKTNIYSTGKIQRRTGSGTFPTGYLGVRPYIYNYPNHDLIKKGTLEFTSTPKESFLWQTYYTASTSVYYHAYSDLYGWNGSNYDMESTGFTPVIKLESKSPVPINDYDVLELESVCISGINEYGLTYGCHGHARMNKIKLDLYAVEGVNGVSGYVYATELDDPIPSSPEEAIEMMKNRSKDDKEISVYAVDGRTVIDTFIISGTLSEGITGNSRGER
jgi:hypothetical protein